jgi:hypothetical protein
MQQHLLDLALSLGDGSDPATGAPGRGMEDAEAEAARKGDPLAKLDLEVGPPWDVLCVL